MNSSCLLGPALLLWLLCAQGLKVTSQHNAPLPSSSSPTLAPSVVFIPSLEKQREVGQCQALFMQYLGVFLIKPHCVARQYLMFDITSSLCYLIHKKA